MARFSLRQQWALLLTASLVLGCLLQLLHLPAALLLGPMIVGYHYGSERRNRAHRQTAVRAGTGGAGRA